jgi:hypothetical protein
MSQGQPWQKLGTPYQKNKPGILAILEVEVGELRSTLCPRKKLETLSKKLKAKWTCDVAHVTQVIEHLPHKSEALSSITGNAKRKKPLPLPTAIKRVQIKDKI